MYLMKRILHEIMKRSILILTMIILLLIWGGIAASQIQTDYLPEINNSTLSVTVRADNYQADQINTLVTQPIQQAVRVVDGLLDVETNSFNGGSLVSLNFPMNFDMEKAEHQVSKALSDIKLPNDVGTPLVTRLSTHSLPIMRLSLMNSNPNLSEDTLRTAVQEDFVNQLKTIPGVKDVRVSGGGSAGYSINLRIADLKSAGLTVDDVKKSLEENHKTELEGKVSNNHISISVQVTGWGITKQDLLNLPIHNKEGKTLSLSDVADISNSIVNLNTISRTNGEPSVLIDVLKTPPSNITELSERIKSRIKEFPALKNRDIQVAILFNQGDQVKDALNGLIKEGLLGCLFSMICVFLFFRKIRSTLLIVISLPICLLTTIGLLKTMGISLNILTVSGLIVAMGRVVDDSIVILDNMNRKVNKEKGKSGIPLLTSSVTEMIPAIVSSTATTIAVYAPIAMIGGMVSSAFSGFAWSVVIALVISLFVSILVVPALYHLFWRGKPISIRDPFEQSSQKIFEWVFDYKKLVVTSFIVLFLLSWVSAAFLPVNFLPTKNHFNQVGIQVEMPQHTSLTEVDKEVKRVESLLQSNPKVASFSSGLGSSFTPQSDDVFDAGGGWIQKPNIANLSIALKKGNEVTDFMQSLKKQLNTASNNAVYTVSNQNMAGDDSLLKINITGADSQKLEAMAQTIRDQLKLIPGLSVQGTAEAEDQITQYQIALNRKAIEHYGIKLEEVINRIQQYTAEGTKGVFSFNQTTFPIVIHSDIQKEGSTDIFSLMSKETFRSKEGQKVTLAQLAVLSPTGSSVIQEKDSRPYAVVTATIVSNDISGVTKEVKKAMGKIPLPEGIKYSFAGAPEQVYEMIYEMAIALLFSILLVLLIISAVFRGWKAPLSVLLCLPLAFIGSVIGMFIFQLEWNLAALVGLLMLTGIAVTNGIVLVDKIESNIFEGVELRQAIISGISTRVRPILMTAGTTILTLVPLVVFGNEDSIISQTLGVVVIGGMISSTLICLLLIPITYEWLNGKTNSLRTISIRKAQ